MFPRSFLFFIIIIIIDLVSKSIKDKKKIEKAKGKKIRDLSKATIPPRENIETIVHKEKLKPLKDEDIFKSEPIVGTTFPTESYQVMDKTEEIEKTAKKKNKEYSNEKFKDDLLKGIIFSEILSKPKGLTNKRKSI